MGEIPRQEESTRIKKESKKDWSHVDELYEKRENKENETEEKQLSSAEKVLAGEDVKGVYGADKNKLKQQLEKEKAITDNQINELKGILAKIHRGESLTKEEESLVKGKKNNKKI